MTVKELLKITQNIYGKSDDRLYDLSDLFYYHQKWLLRFIEDKKHENMPSALTNLMISIAWYGAIVNRFHIDLENILERRYSYKCPFCLELPCNCESKLKRKAKKTGRPVSGRPQNLREWQKLILKIYPEPPEFRNLEILRYGELMYQAYRQFRRASAKRNFHQIETVTADYFVDILKVANNLGIDITDEFGSLFQQGCFVCHELPCECFYRE